MKSAMGELCPVFNTNRMVHQYYVEGYGPALERRALLEDDDCRRARDLARWKQRARACWDRVRIERVEVDLPEETTIGKTFQVRAWVQAPGLTVGELAVQMCLGRLRENREIGDPEILPMAHCGPATGDELLYEATICCRTSGTHGVTVRVLPYHPDLGHCHETGLITWAS